MELNDIAKYLDEIGQLKRVKQPIICKSRYNQKQVHLILKRKLSFSSQDQLMSYLISKAKACQQT